MNFWSKVGLGKRSHLYWALYDVGNSAFATTVMVAVLPIFYSEYYAKNLEPHLRTAYWAYSSTLGLLFTAILSPALGAWADQRRLKKPLLMVFTAMGVVATGLMCFGKEGDWFVISLLYVIGLTAFGLATVCYEALLPHIANEEEVHNVSIAGYGLGYLGGGILLALNIAWITKPELFGMPSVIVAVKASFASVSLWWLVFTIPILFIDEPESPSSMEQVSFWDAAKNIFGGFASSFRKLRSYPEAFRFLIAFWLYSDGIGTIIKMATIYGAEIGIGKDDLIGAVLLVQFLGFPATFMFCSLCKRLGVKKGIDITLLGYIAISVLGYFMTKAWHFWLLAAGISAVQGASQALSRSLYSSMIPKEQSCEFFGFFSFSSKFAGIIGPLLFAIAAQGLGSSRYGILLVIGLFVTGMAFLNKVDVEKGIREAKRS
ncbi:MAG: MFS transporter [Oligoflexales bacterium]